MSFKKLTVFFLILPISLADVVIETTPGNVIAGQTFQMGGLLTASITGNDFNEASDKDLVLRIRFNHLAFNQETRAGWPGQNPATIFQPILIPCELINAPVGSKIAAPIDTFRIIRWAEQEDTLYIQVRHSSTNWIEDPIGNLVPPSNNNGQIRLMLGLSQEESSEYFSPLFSQELANLPSIQREAPGSTEIPILTTEFLFDLTQSTLSVYPSPNSELRFDNIVYQLTGPPWGYTPEDLFVAPIGTNFFQLGIGFGVNVYGDDVLAIAVGSTQVPTLGSFGVLVFGALLIACGIFFQRRQR